MQRTRIEVVPDSRQNTSGQTLTEADVETLTELARTTETNCHTVITRPGSPRDLRYGWTYRDLNRESTFGAWAIHADGEVVWAQIAITEEPDETSAPEGRPIQTSTDTEQRQGLLW